MAAAPTPQQTLLLWRLIAEGGQFQADIKPKVGPKDRDPLLRARLIRAEQRKKDGKGRAQTFLDATDAGWSWAADHLDAPIARSQEAAPILQAWLTKLMAYMQRTGTPLAAILSEQKEADPLPTGAIEEIEGQIQSAYLAVTGGRWHERARLSSMRPLLAGVPRETLDTKLREMQRAKRLVLYRLDNPREIEPADHDAAISIGGEPVHIVYMGRP